MTGGRWVPVDRLRGLADPVAVWPWQSIPFTDWAEIGRVAAVSVPVEDGVFATLQHVGRVRWLLEQGWDDPIQVDVGCFGQELWWPIVDGNHRLAAAILRGDPRILVEVSGDLDDANLMLHPDRPW